VPRDPFRFRQFAVRHEQCGQPVCTDSILLGAWATVGHATRALDVGTGCGLLALMLAQRNARLRIDAIDSSAAAAGEARANFAASPWPERLVAEQVTLEQFAGGQDVATCFDLVICNPPWHGRIEGDTAERSRARQMDSLGPQAVIRQAELLLAPRGILSLLLPTAAAGSCVATAISCGLHLQRRTDLVGKPGKPARRILVEFGRGNGESGIPRSTARESILLTNEAGEPSREFRELTGEYYLPERFDPMCLQHWGASDTLAG
jgi:tRNA1Val (adenine37-N6)-methyltransferase